MLLKNCSYIITQNNNREILQNQDILIENNQIVKIGRHLTHKNTIDCKNKIVLPGLINLHTHIGMHSLRGICDDEELEVWLKKVIEQEKKFTPKDIEQSAQLACKEHIRFGTTTFLEMYTPIEPIEQAVKKAKIRAVLCDVPHGGLGSPTKQIKNIKDSILKKIGKDNLITYGLALHSIYLTPELVLKEAKLFAKEHNLLTPIHIAETRKERYDIIKEKTLLPVQYLESINFLDQNTLLVHTSWITKGEIRTIAKYNSSVIHCPTSNMKLATGGVMPLMEMIPENIRVGLGTDSVASNNSLDMFTEMKITGLLHKHHYWDPKAANVQKILDMTTIDAAKIIGKEKEIGSLEPGKKADIITIDIQPHHLPINNILSNLIYSTNGNDVTDVIIDGILLLKDKKFQ